MDKQLILNKVKERMEQASMLFPQGGRAGLNLASVDMKINDIERFLEGQIELWDQIQNYKIGLSSLSSLMERYSDSHENPTPDILLYVLDKATKNIKVIHVESEGRKFKAFVNFLMVEKNTTTQDTIMGLEISGNHAACRAIFGSLHSQRQISVTDETTGEETVFNTAYSYRRFEEVNGKICHMFILPPLAVTDSYEEECISAESAKRPHPDRIIIDPDGNVDELIGQFLANKYALPRTKDWADNYFSLLPEDKYKELEIVKTDLIGQWDTVRAIIIRSMKEDEMLAIVDEAIRNHQLNVYTSVGDNAVFEANMTTEDYLRANAEFIANRLDEYLTPRYDGKTYLQYIAETNRICVPAQASAVMTTLTVLKTDKNAFLIGDTGTGKTQMSLTLAHCLRRIREDSGAADGTRVLIIAPSITVPKWEGQEIPKILGKRRVNTIVIQSTEDALSYIEKVKSGYKVPKGFVEFVLISTDRMKLTANKFVLGAKWNEKKKVFCCPDCGNAIVSPKAKKEESDLLVSWDDAVEKPSTAPTLTEIEEAKREGKLQSNGLPEGYVIRWSAKIRQMKCDNCAKKLAERKAIKEIRKERGLDYKISSEMTKDEIEALHRNFKKMVSDRVAEKKKEITQKFGLSRPASKDRGEDNVKKRWMIAQLFQHMLPNHFHLGIFDEVHQMKAHDSGRGLSFHKILKSCRKYLCLTATLTNGASSSIQATLWRTNPAELIANGFSHSTSKEAWAARYGVLEEVTYRKDEGVVGRNTNRRQERVQIKEKPGIASQLVTDYLLDKSVFVEMSDLHIPLVKKDEIPIIVTLDPEHKAAYQEFHNRLDATCTDLQHELGSKAWSMFNPATLNYADQPSYPADIKFYDEEGHVIGHVTGKSFPKDYYTAKERKLVELVKKELAEERGCIVYNNFTGDYQSNERLQEVLAAHGIPSEILSTDTTSSLGRFDWLEKRKSQGPSVLIMNMRLVEVGLDLLEWPTLIFYQMNDNIDTDRQAAGRDWRIGQHRACRIYYLVNGGTQQMAQFQRLMSRRVNALLVEGRIEKSDSLARYANDEFSALTRDIASLLSAEELSDTWKAAAAKDMDQNLELVDEDQFQERIKQAFVQLTAETMRLCGVTQEEIEQYHAEISGEQTHIEQDESIFDLAFTSEIIEDEQIVQIPQELDLFSLFEISIEEVKPKGKRAKSKAPEEPVAQLTLVF